MASTTKFISHSSWNFEMSEIKAQADPVSSEGSLPDIQIAIFVLHPHTADSRERPFSHVSSYKGTNPIQEASNLMTWLLSKGPHPNPITLGIQALTYKFSGGHEHLPHSKDYPKWDKHASRAQKTFGAGGNIWDIQFMCINLINCFNYQGTSPNSLDCFKLHWYSDFKNYLSEY